MNEAAFSVALETLVGRIEEAVDAACESHDAALDYENNGGVLTILCEDSNTQVIVSGQLALRQIWVAAKSGGFHCDFNDGRWVCRTTGESLGTLLSRVCTEQSDEPCVLSNID